MGGYIKNMETLKLELHFEKSEYMALDESAKKEIKSNFLFSRHTGAWISRAKYPYYSALRVAEKLGLEDGGKQGELLTFEEQQEIKQKKAENRANRYEHKSVKAIEDGKQLQAPINEMHGDIAFFTQPNINTSSGRAFTRRREKMWSMWERGFEEFKKSEYYKERAEIARENAKKPTDKSFCERRIKEADSDIKVYTKNLDACTKRLGLIEKGEKIKKNYSWQEDEYYTIEETQENIEHWEIMLEQAISKKCYYDKCLDDLGGIQFSKENIKPGYKVRINHWSKAIVTVVSCGPKNFTCIGGHGRHSYAEIIEIIEAPTEQKILHPFVVGDAFTVERWNGKNTKMLHIQ